jgi:hypothetical protein
VVPYRKNAATGSNELPTALARRQRTLLFRCWGLSPASSELLDGCKRRGHGQSQRHVGQRSSDFRAPPRHPVLMRPSEPSRRSSGIASRTSWGLTGITMGTYAAVISHRPRCGAKTRAGRPCRMRVEFGKARCRLHGGLSTGPKTEAGRTRIAEAQRRRWREYRKAHKDRQPAEVQPSLEVKAEQHATEGHLCGTQIVATKVR